jgi:hypothetical protein
LLHRKERDIANELALNGQMGQIPNLKVSFVHTVCFSSEVCFPSVRKVAPAMKCFFNTRVIVVVFTLALIVSGCSQSSQSTQKYHYTFRIENVDIQNMTSRWPWHDNDYIVVTLTVGKTNYVQKFHLNNGTIGKHALPIQFTDIPIESNPASPIPIAFNYQIVNDASQQNQDLFNRLVEEGLRLGIQIAKDGISDGQIWGLVLGGGIIAGVLIIDHLITGNYCGGTVVLGQVTQNSDTILNYFNRSGTNTGAITHQDSRAFKRSDVPFLCDSPSYDIAWSITQRL